MEKMTKTNIINPTNTINPSSSKNTTLDLMNKLATTQEKQIVDLQNQQAFLLAEVTSLREEITKLKKHYHQDSIVLDGLNDIYKQAIRAEGTK